MLALSSSSLFSPFGLLEDQICHEQDLKLNDPLLDFNHINEWNSFDSFVGCSSPPLDNNLHNAKHSSGTTSSDPSFNKKLNHNASERDRRKKLNSLCSTLQSLLPNIDNTKKLSIPSTICHVLKYIPQLQSQVERLKQRKETLLSISKQNDSSTHYTRQSSVLHSTGQSLPTVSARRIDDSQVVIHICTLKKNRSIFSEVLEIVEGDNNLHILNASVITSSENSLFYTLHVQVNGTQRVECEVLSEKILCLFQ
ncbi:Transcription factor org2 [Thalictrum thalictroides]|uniref:Transcription factor org2 n=1 Tax=Thalictrum thalictroides TaxID=46969 RepID=A0A7J6W3D5_THATH|nr:Transcription factor org2 [Thalictrum thalictroides]